MRIRQQWIFGVLVAGFLASCSARDELTEVDQVNTELTAKGSVGDSRVGLDENNDMVLQTETAADDELRVQFWVNNKLDDDLERERFHLRECRSYLADPRIGGHAQVKDIPEPDSFQVTRPREELGLDADGNYKVVKTEKFARRLKAERAREKSLRRTIRVVGKILRRCQHDLRLARVRHGLPAEKYKAEGYFAADGTWIVTQDGERTLDDAFAITAKRQARALTSR